MRILYDGQIYKYQAAGGISRYFANVVSKLPESYTPLLTVPQQHKVLYPTQANLKVWRYKHFRPAQISHRLEKYYFRAITALTSFDLAHPTYYSLLTGQELSHYRTPVVLTVHDLIHEIFRAQIDPLGRQIEQKRQAILAAQRLICVSENTKKDLIDVYSIPEDKISVIPQASSITKELSYGPEKVPSRPYYLHVGSRDACYKNFDTLLTAFAKAVSVRPEILLCVVGYPFNEAEVNLINDLNLSDRIQHFGYASDTHLAKLYRCSIALVYPSLYEGFGIPPLEAMSCGTVVVASNSSSLPEVVGDAGLLFNPKATTDLADILLALLNNQVERDRLIAAGYQRAQKFSWEKTVAQTLNVYASVRN